MSGAELAQLFNLVYFMMHAGLRIVGRLMKKFLLGTASAICMVGPALAADHLPVKAPAPVPAYSWTGFYGGFNVGGAVDSSSTTEAWNWINTYPAGSLIGVNGGPLVTVGGAAAGSPPAPFTTTTRFTDQYRHSAPGLIGGLEAGYNWESGRTVLGVEADFSWSGQNDTVNYTAQPVTSQFPPFPLFFFAPGTTQGWSSQEKIDWLTTFRARLGVTSDTSLWYVTGGVAAARIDNNYTLVSSPGSAGAATTANGAQWGLPGGIATANFSTTRVGWVVGAGVETAISRWLGWGPGWTAKLEYLFADLGTVSNAIGTGLVSIPTGTAAGPFATGTTTFTSSSHIYEQIVRVGMNYKFKPMQ